MKGTIKDSIGLPFTIFRGRDAVDYAEAECMEAQPVSPEEQTRSIKLFQAGLSEGTQVKLLFSRPGFSLTWVWFKSGFPLPRHSHDADCTYFIVAGSLRIGTEELAAGDGFFVGKDVPYTYTAGADGVELLEMRTANAFDIKLLAGSNPAWWEKALGTLVAAQGRWAEEGPPSALGIATTGGSGDESPPGADKLKFKALS
jgi:quercetin dioxygenase-like cupin family protein